MNSSAEQHPERRLQLATFKDAYWLWHWKNQPDTRKFSIMTHEPIRFSDHTRWLEKTLQNPLVKLFVIMQNGVPRGDLRFDYQSSAHKLLLGYEGAVEVSVRIDTQVQRCGLASWAISHMLSPEGRYMARIVEGNIASMRAFLKCGFLPHAYVTSPIGHYLFQL